MPQPSGHAHDAATTLDHASSELARLEQLVLAGAALTAESSLDGVLHRVAAIAAEVIGARYAAIAVMTPDDDRIEHFVAHGLTPEQQRRIGDLPSHHGLLGEIMQGGAPIRLGNLAAHPHAAGFPAHHPHMHSFLGVPVVGRRGPIGNLYITEKRDGGHFTAADEHVAVLLAAKAGAAVENARLHEESAHLLAEVQRLHRTRERFFAMVNHEMRNALAAVYGWAEMLVRKKDPSTVPLAAYEVLDSAQQAVDLISDLLDLSRLDEDRLQPVIRSVRVADLVQRAVGRVTPGAAPRQLILQVAVDPDLPVIETDANRVEQILVNLLSNAIKFTAPASTIRIEAALADDAVRIAVQDEGPGIRPEDAERIFDVYVTSAEGEKQGVGLGLPLSRRLAQLLGGALWAEPQDGGGLFVLQLPVRRGA
jgi:signal transduction histidine kinase